MEQTVRAIVLRRRDSGESDRRLTLLTDEFGKIDAVAKGARKSASRLGSVSEPLSVALMTLAEGKRNRFVTQAQPLSSFRGLREDYDRLNYALALAEIVALVVPYEEPSSEVLAALEASLFAISVSNAPMAPFVWAQMRLLDLFGFMPQTRQCVVSGVPVDGAEPYLSPMAGGYVCQLEAAAFSDRMRTRAEVLYNMDALKGRAEAPATLKYANETLIALAPFWRDVAGCAIPSLERIVGELRAG